MGAAKNTTRNPWSAELDDLIRAASGGFLVGIPLLYTMEVWWVGSLTVPSRMLVALVVTFVVVFLLNRTGGFRKTSDMRLVDAAIDSVEALAIGIVCTSLLLLLLREITFDTALDEVLGKVIFEAAPFSLGVALASQFLSDARVDKQDDEIGDRTNEAPRQDQGLNATLSDIGATAVGALFIAFNIAPTDEIPMLAAAVTGPWLVAMIFASLVISYGIVFEAGFASQKKRAQQKGIFQRPLSETVMSYLVSLVAAAAMLWFFHQLSFDDPWQMWLSHSVLLGLPATIGGAAGRLAV